MFALVFLALFPLLLKVNGKSDLGFSRSSYLHTKEHYILPGHVLERRRVASILSCAQACLSDAKCKSFCYLMSQIRMRGVCELKSHAPHGGIESNELTFSNGSTYGLWSKPPVATFVFTTLGSKGGQGPARTSGYSGTLLGGKVQLDEGIQIWKVPVTGRYVIEAFGASGANGTCVNVGCQGWRTGGKGARVRGIFTLRAGQRLKILVGQEGLGNEFFNDRPGGGGGGSFVTFTDDKPLVIAGDGGGGGIALPGSEDGDPGQSGQDGTRHGGVSGSGGRLYDTTNNKSSPSYLLAGSGAGLHGDGVGQSGMSALSFEHGGGGGMGAYAGGFGGGGFALTQPGGGGGYSGGGVLGTNSTGAAGGGGSYNNGTMQIMEAGVKKGDGDVVITLLD